MKFSEKIFTKYFLKDITQHEQNRDRESSSWKSFEYALFCTLILYYQVRKTIGRFRLRWQLLNRTIGCHWHTKPLITSVTTVLIVVHFSIAIATSRSLQPKHGSSNRLRSLTDRNRTSVSYILINYTCYIKLKYIHYAEMVSQALCARFCGGNC